MAKFVSMPPHILVKKMLQKTSNKLNNLIERSKDLNRNTHIEFDVPLIQNSYLNIQELEISEINNQEASYLSKMYCSHRFDLLGSGWVKNSYTSLALGVEGYKYNMNITAPKPVSSDYVPIDWQKDYKSGFRWSKNTWYKDINYGKHLGVDIKVPWEMARLQHLPQLAIFAMVDEKLKKQSIMDFKNQILDFIAHNPPRFGVNWSCTMDVGIRVANMLIAHDMFCQMDDEDILDRDFKQAFSNSVYEHGFHIVNNLEFNGDQTNNHYMSDVAALLFVSAYLESSEEVNNWLAFAIQELIWCMKTQFYEDGGNFESSTNYHRLSAEIMTYSTALILGLKDEKVDALQNYDYKSWKFKPELLPLNKQEFTIDNSKLIINLPQWYVDRLFNAGRFTVDLTKPSGELPQIGDNDSGRFFRLSPIGKLLTNAEAEKIYLNLKSYNEHIKSYSHDDELFWDENILDHRTFISAISGLFDDTIFNNSIMLERSIIASIGKRKILAKNKFYSDQKISNMEIEKFQYSNKLQYTVTSQFDNLRLISYPDSGLYIFKADNMHLTICVTPLGINDGGGHGHNDKLSYELWLDGKDIVKDPGTYLYLPLPDRRNMFRSLSAHNAPSLSKEQNLWDNGINGLFSMSNDTSCIIQSISKFSIVIYLSYRKYYVVRSFKFEHNTIEIFDQSNYEFIKDDQYKYYSNGYGKLSYAK